MTSLKYAELDPREIDLHATCRRLHAADPTSLPGRSNRTADDNARLVFELDGRRESRYFRTTADARKAKAEYRGTWRPALLQYWHHRELIWC
jgi:hypothetical protein